MCKRALEICILLKQLAIELLKSRNFLFEYRKNLQGINLKKTRTLKFNHMNYLKLLSTMIFIYQIKWIYNFLGALEGGETHGHIENIEKPDRQQHL